MWLKKFCGQAECGCGLRTSSTLGGVSEAPDHMVHMSWAVVSCQNSRKLLLSLCFSWSVLTSWWNGIIIPNMNILHLLHPKEYQSFLIMLKRKRGCGNPKITLMTKKGYLQIIWFTFSVSVCVEREGCQHVANTSLQYSQSLQTGPAHPGSNAGALWVVWAPELLR